MDINAIREAIGHIESSGNYGALGPTTANGQRAYGKYQVMDFNIPEWTKEATGTSVTPQQYLANPKLQDTVANFQMGKILKQYGDPNQVASVWFSGRPSQQAGNAADVTGTTTPQYIQRFQKALGNQTTTPLFVQAPQPSQVTTGGTVTTGAPKPATPSIGSRVAQAFGNLISSAPVTYEAPQTYAVRGVPITEPDLNEAKKVIFAEVSNRDPAKQELEARVLLNTAINRAQAYQAKGQNVSLSDVLKMPNQYQGYNSSQYKLYSNPQVDVPTASKRNQVNAIVDRLSNEIKAQKFTDNTSGAYYYQHNKGKIYYDNRKPLFKSRPASLFVQK